MLVYQRVIIHIKAQLIVTIAILAMVHATAHPNW